MPAAAAGVEVLQSYICQSCPAACCVRRRRPCRARSAPCPGTRPGWPPTPPPSWLPTAAAQQALRCAAAGADLPACKAEAPQEVCLAAVLSSPHLHGRTQAASRHVCPTRVTVSQLTAAAHTCCMSSCARPPLRNAAQRMQTSGCAHLTVSWRAMCTRNSYSPRCIIQ